jgi:hypothetical protein
MSLPSSEPLSPEEQHLPPARLRRRKRMLVPGQLDGQAAYLTDLAHYVTPSLDFFIFSFLAGITLGVACILDSPAIFFLASLLSPFMAPVIGLSLASVFGSKRFFLQSLAGVAIGSALVFLGGALAGLATIIWPILNTSQAQYHTHFSWTDFLVLTAGSVITVILLVRAPHQKPLVSSVALAYGIYLPIGIAGFGLVGNLPGLWPDGLVVYAVHLAWATLIGTAAFAVIGLRSNTVFGYTLSSSLVLISIIAVIAISGFGTAVSTDLGIPTFAPSHTRTPTISPTLTFTPAPSTFTPSPTNTLVPTSTRTRTVSPMPTPVWGKINANESDGAVIREKPEFGSLVVKTMLNGSLVQILPETQLNRGYTWVHVHLPEGMEGWIIQTVLVTATASPLN